MAAKGKAGRPVNGYPLIIYNVSIGLHPVLHAHVIARINAAPKGKKASVIVDMMVNGAETPVETLQPESKPAAVKIQVLDDGF